MTEIKLPRNGLTQNEIVAKLEAMNLIKTFDFSLGVLTADSQFVRFSDPQKAILAKVAY